MSLEPIADDVSRSFLLFRTRLTAWRFFVVQQTLSLLVHIGPALIACRLQIPLMMQRDWLRRS